MKYILGTYFPSLEYSLPVGSALSPASAMLKLSLKASISVEAAILGFRAVMKRMEIHLLTQNILSANAIQNHKNVTYKPHFLSAIIKPHGHILFNPLYRSVIM
jgi:hypothetical protein